MALTTNPKVWKFLLLIVAVLTALFFLLFYFTDLVITFLLGALLIFITKKLYDKSSVVLKYFPNKNGVRYAYFTAVLIFAAVCLFYLVAITVHDLSEVLSIVRSSDANLQTILAPKVGAIVPDSIEASLFTEKNIQTIRSTVLTFLAQLLSAVGGILANAMLIVPLLFYLYYGRRKVLYDKVYGAVPLQFKKLFVRVFTRTKKELDDFCTAKFLQSFMLAGVCCLGFYLGGLKGWLFFGILAGLMNMIPYVGPLIGTIPPLFIALLQPEMSVVYFVLGTVVVSQIFDNWYVTPFMLSSRVNMDPLVSILMILIGSTLLGALGMLLAIPIYSVYKIVITESYQALVEMFDRKASK